MKAAKQVQFQLLDEISDKYQQGHTYNNLKTGAPLLVGQLVDENCVSIFTRHHVNIIKNGKLIIKGRQNLSNGFYNTPLTPTAEPLIPSSNYK